MQSGLTFANLKCKVEKCVIWGILYNKPHFNTNIIYFKLRVASSNARYYVIKNQLFVKRSQYIRIEYPLQEQSEKGYMCF